jgi:hypothetical protein
VEGGEGDERLPKPPSSAQAVPTPRRGGARSPARLLFSRVDAEAPGCKASGRGSSVTHLLGYPTQNVSRSLRRKYAPPPRGGPEDVALVPRTAAAAAACEAGPSPVYVKVKSAEPADCAEGPQQVKDGLVV